MSNIIDSIQLSGVTYGIKGSGGTETIELTQAQYDALVDKDPNVFYIITDAQAGDLTNYYTKTETNTLLGGKADTATTYTKTEVDNAISAVKRDAVTINAFEESTNTNLIGFSLANVDGTLTSGCNVAWVGDGLVKTYTRYLKVNFTSGITSASTETQVPSAKVVYDELQNKQNTLSAGTGIDITNDVISVTGGGSITIDPSLDSGSTNAVANSAITTAINAVSGAIPSTYVSSISKDTDHGWKRFVRFSTPSNFNYFILDNPKINGTPIHIFDGIPAKFHNFSLVETSAITTSISSSSTDSQVPSAKAVNDKLSGLSIVKLSQSEYDALATKDSNTLFVIVN